MRTPTPCPDYSLRESPSPPPAPPNLYPPVARSNLLEQLQWARAHDEAAREIASRGASFIDHEMDAHHRWCAMHAAVGAVANQQRGRRVNASIACALVGRPEAGHRHWATGPRRAQG